ncbi:hypothetical protein C8Q80DRAFT_917134 [Daedaleopsis nitida]|nr:hypothetical protein C8Q80DRAFT_917134 [Daedaleopsis nitida]
MHFTSPVVLSLFVLSLVIIQASPRYAICALLKLTSGTARSCSVIGGSHLRARYCESGFKGRGLSFAVIPLYPCPEILPTRVYRPTTSPFLRHPRVYRTGRRLGLRRALAPPRQCFETRCMSRSQPRLPPCSDHTNVFQIHWQDNKFQALAQLRRLIFDASFPERERQVLPFFLSCGDEM